MASYQVIVEIIAQFVLLTVRFSTIVTIADKIRDFIRQLRHLRIFIAIWNLVVIFLMVVYVQFD